MSRQKQEITSENVKPIATQEEFEKLIIDNEKFAYSVVQKEFGKYSSEIKEDLCAAAIEGLAYAATKYDPAREKECKFISYAVHWIRYYINEQIRKFYPVKLNQNFIAKRKKVNHFIEKFEKENGYKPDVFEISASIGMSQKVVENILKVNEGKDFQFVSFNAPSMTEDSGESESLNENKLVNQYLNQNLDTSTIDKIELKDIMESLKKEVSIKDYKIFYDYYINGQTFTELKRKYNLPFASSVSYVIKKCENICKELVEK